MQLKQSVAAAGCQVLPLCDTAASMGTKGDDMASEKDAQRGRKAVSRMKELVRWAAATKASKAGIKRWKVLYLRNKMGAKDIQEDDASSSSSKIGFRWDVGSCSASSCAFSPLSAPSHPAAVLQMDRLSAQGCSRGGQWITSDSDFVVLEL